MIEEEIIKPEVRSTEWKTLGEVVAKQTKKATPQEYPNAKFIGMDCIEPHSLRPSFLHDFKNFKSSGNHFSKGQVLYGRMRPYLNKVYRAEFDGACSGEFIVMECKPSLLPDYLKYALHSREFVRFANEKTSGDRPRISFDEIAEYSIRIPSVEEQQQIVSKIEELFSELDKGIEELKTARQQLKVYRQAVLKWAFEGRLTNEDVKEGELPKGWSWKSLGNIITHIGAGKSFRCEERPPKQGEVGIIKVSSVTWGFFDQEESKTCFFPDMLNESFLVNKGDFLFSRANTIELIGACVIVQNVTKKLMLSDKILRFTFTETVSKEYALYYLRSRRGRREIERLSTGNQESMRNIGQEKIKQIAIALPDRKMQDQVVQEIESRLSVCNEIEEAIKTSLKQSEALRQGILRDAISGML